MVTNNLAQLAFQQNANDYIDRATSSALSVLPYVLEEVKPRSVVDIGCGGAAWLAACMSLGVQDVLGIDGDYVDRAKLKIPSERFLAHDLKEPLRLERTFELAISLEVAEHIPKSKAEDFIDLITSLSPVVLFSAAIPFQGGIGHINEQWPTYWEELFRSRDYIAIDCIRRKIWNNQDIDTWYRQNILIFCQSSYVSRTGIFLRESVGCDGWPLDLVHPNHYLGEADPQRIDYRKVPLRTAWRALTLQLRREMHSRLHWRLQRILPYR